MHMHTYMEFIYHNAVFVYLVSSNVIKYVPAIEFHINDPF